jgi:hypothetical protein
MKSEYHKIFWKAGQEITPETFIQADNYICAQQNLIRKFLNRQYYGLLPAGESGAPSFSVNANLQGPDIRIEQLNCHAITKEGYLIDFDNELLSNMQQDRLSFAACPQGIYYVVLRVFPFEHTLLEPVENEETPCALPVFEFDLKTLKHISGNEMPVLKIDYSRQAQPAIDRNYIPPCMSLNAYEQLMDNFLSLKQSAYAIQSLLLKEKEQYGELAYPISMLLFDLEQFSLSDSPYYLIHQLKKFILTIGYFIKQLQKKTEEVVNILYHHNDISGILQSIDKCFWDIQLFLGENVVEEEEDFTPKI